MHKNSKIPRSDSQEKSFVRRLDPLKISAAASKFNMTHQSSIHSSWKVDISTDRFVILASFIVWHCLFVINYPVIKQGDSDDWRSQLWSTTAIIMSI